MKIPQYTRDDIAPLTQKFTLAHLFVVGCMVSLVVVFTWANLVREQSSLLLWLVQCVPLLIFIPGLISKHYRAYSWLCFVILFYFTAAVVEAMSPFRQITDYFLVALSVILFCAAMMASRWRQHQLLAIRQNPV